MSKQNVEGILSRIKEVCGVESDSDLARALGVSQGVVSNWRARGSVKLTTVIAKGEELGVDLHWLLTGERRESATARRITLDMSDGRRQAFVLRPEEGE